MQLFLVMTELYLFKKILNYGFHFPFTEKFFLRVFVLFSNTNIYTFLNQDRPTWNANEDMKQNWVYS